MNNKDSLVKQLLELDSFAKETTKMLDELELYISLGILSDSMRNKMISDLEEREMLLHAKGWQY